MIEPRSPLASQTRGEKPNLCLAIDWILGQLKRVKAEHRGRHLRLHIHNYPIYYIKGSP
jgi:hypothetical protein